MAEYEAVLHLLITLGLRGTLQCQYCLMFEYVNIEFCEYCGYCLLFEYVNIVELEV